MCECYGVQVVGYQSIYEWQDGEENGWWGTDVIEVSGGDRRRGGVVIGAMVTTKLAVT